METVLWRSDECALLCYPQCLKSPLVTRKHGTNSAGDAKIESTAPASAPKCTKKKRCRLKHVPNPGEVKQQEHFSQVRALILSCFETLTETGRSLHYFPVNQTESTGYNRSCQADLQGLCALDAIVPLPSSSLLSCPPFIELSQDINVDVDVFSSVVTNTRTNSALILKCCGEQFSIPPQSTFLLSDISKISLLVNHTVAQSERYNLVVIDPPWENRSAIRGHKYQWLEEEDIRALPVASLVAPCGLVAVWVTNKRKLVEAVRERLFPYWGVQPLAEWIWIKVTTRGEFVHDLDSVHKKPYEIVVVGRSLDKREEDSCVAGLASEHSVDTAPPLNGSCSQTHTSRDHKRKRSTGSSSNSSHDSKRIKPDSSCQHPPSSSEELSPLPLNYMFMCVSSAVHSQKPYLGDLLSPYLKGSLHGVELFARNLLPNWTSWGNEVLKYQTKVL